MSNLGREGRNASDPHYRARAVSLVDKVKGLHRDGYNLHDLYETVMKKQVSIDCLRRIIKRGSFPSYQNLCKIEALLKGHKTLPSLDDSASPMICAQIAYGETADEKIRKHLPIHAEPEEFSMTRLQTILRIDRRPVMLQGYENELLYVLPLWEPSWCESCESNGDSKGVAEMIIYEPLSTVFTFNHRKPLDKTPKTGYKKICMACFQRLYHQRGICDWMMR
jgi:hypothetical protein